MTGANLSGATLRGAILSNAKLAGAQLSGVDISGAILDREALKGATGIEDLQGATLRRVTRQEIAEILKRHQLWLDSRGAEG